LALHSYLNGGKRNPLSHFPSLLWLLLQLSYTGAKDLPAAEISLRAIDDEGIDLVLEGTKQVREG